jgi:hypothetical protein
MKKLLLLLTAILMIATSFYKKTNSEVNSKKFLSTKIEKNSGKTTEFSEAETLYNAIEFNNSNKLELDVFEKAILGFNNLKKAGKIDEESHLLTICDFSLSSTQKRFWVIDLNDKKILFNSLVAHGKNTGEEFARKFSNTESSLQSSLGFYVTESTYYGSNGFSLKLHGMDKGFNDRALQRAIVMHGADYVSEDFIKSQRRIGRSWGCPAVPTALAKPIINTIKDKNVIFIYYPDEKYLSSSVWLNA